MKRIFMGALTVLLFAGAAQAQKKDSMRHGHHKGRTEMVTKLNLTTDQQAQLKSIREARQAEMKVLHENKTRQAAQRKTAREEMSKKYAARSKAVYTPAQLDQLEKMKAERKAKGKDSKHAGKKAKGMDGKHAGKAAKGQKHDKELKKDKDFKKELNLTEDQKSKMSVLREDFKKEFETLRNDQSLSAEQKKEKSKELRKAQQVRMKAILTKDQIEKMKSTRKDRKPVQR